MNGRTGKLSAGDSRAQLETLHTRFKRNPDRYRRKDWADVAARLEGNPAKLWSLAQMEATGGEPDVVSQDLDTGELIFCDCAAESPKGRRSLCYDRAALDSRTENKPVGDALTFAAEIGIELLTEREYRVLQRLGTVDTKSSSWLATPPEIRTHGGAIFGDYRFGTVFVYCNGAESYYAARGFRGSLRV